MGEISHQTSVTTEKMVPDTLQGPGHEITGHYF